ncbi:MAG: endonuclease/exonuclease/phosphatase family protein [Gemmatimonadota bacterium]|jgi:endonuclease/exonuclease/phosphatase family metal-dependent hydrolase
MPKRPPIGVESIVTSSGTLLLVCALVAPAMGVAAQEAVPPADSLSLEVMTFNIRTSAGRDGNDAWPFRKDLVAQTIDRSAPDLLGLQEALSDQIEFLADALPAYRWLGVDRGLNGGRGLSEATPIFYRYDELVPIESGTFWLGDLPEPRRRDGRERRRGRGSRIVTWARFHHLESARELYVFNTHFTLREGRRQLEGAEMINDRIASLPSGTPVILMGDFNAVAGSSETWDVATSTGLQDAWRVAGAHDGPAVTSNGFGPPPNDWEGRIDWILVGGPIAVPSIATIVHSVDGRYPSDHYPVLATLEILPG